MTTQTVLCDKDTAKAGELYISFELGDKKWKVTASDGCRGPSRYNVEAGDTTAVADCIRKAADRCKLEPQCKAHSCRGIVIEEERAPPGRSACATADRRSVGHRPQFSLLAGSGRRRRSTRCRRGSLTPRALRR